MRNALLATAAMAFVSSPAMAADKLSVGVGGYMQQWVGMSSVDDDDKKVSDGTAQQSDSEIFFKGSLEADNGLTFSVKVELEGNGGGDIDESQLTVGGEFGKVTLGAEDPASTLTHKGGLDVGVSLNCGDTHKWVGGLAGCSHNGFGTYGHGHGDKNQIMYFSPRVSGVQFGLSYIPDRSQEGGNNALNDNETDAWAVGGNYVGDFGGANVAFSLGHYQGSQVGETEDIFDGQNHVGAKPIASLYRVRDYDSDDAAIKGLAAALAGDTADSDDTTGDTVEELRTAAKAAKDRMANHMVSTMVKADDKTFSNVAVQVGVGSFSFGVVYAENDGGAYEIANADRALTAAEFEDLQGAGLPYASGDTYNVTTGVVIDADHTFDLDGDPSTTDDNDTQESATNNDTSNDNPMIRMDKVVEDKSMNWDTWGVGVKYTEGAMAISLSHLATEWDNGDEQEASMLSVSYTLAPGVASKTSLFTAERSFVSGREIDGTAFVTGIAIGF